jgi:hypothetical protein
MKFNTRDPNSTSEWMSFFAWLPIKAGRGGDRFIWVWLETAEYRWVPIGKFWGSAAWECRPADTPEEFITEMQVVGAPD